MFTGVVHVTWETTCYTNGKPGDTPYIIILQKLNRSVVDEYYNPTVIMHGPYNDGHSTRGDGQMDYTIQTGISAGELTLYLYFVDLTSQELKRLLSTSISDTV
jgi:hypothetical protein